MEGKSYSGSVSGAGRASQKGLHPPPAMPALGLRGRGGQVLAAGPLAPWWKRMRPGRHCRRPPHTHRVPGLTRRGPGTGAVRQMPFGGQGRTPSTCNPAQGPWDSLTWPRPSPEASDRRGTHGQAEAEAGGLAGGAGPAHTGPCTPRLLCRRPPTGCSHEGATECSPHMGCRQPISHGGYRLLSAAA